MSDDTQRADYAPPRFRCAIEVDGVALCTGPWDDGDGHYIHKQMENYYTISPDSEVRAVITFQAGQRAHIDSSGA